MARGALLAKLFGVKDGALRQTWRLVSGLTHGLGFG